MVLILKIEVYILSHDDVALLNEWSLHGESPV